MAALTSLTELKLGCAFVSDEASFMLPQLAQMHQLRELELHGRVSVPNTTTAEFTASMVQCSSLTRLRTSCKAPLADH